MTRSLSARRRVEIVPGRMGTVTIDLFLTLRVMATRWRMTDRFPRDAFNDDLMDDSERAELRSCPPNWRVIRGGRQ